MGISELCALPVEAIADRDCALFLWATYPMLCEALQVMGAWGFAYKTLAFQWIKRNRSGNGWFFGLGRWTRGNSEPCLLGIRGKPSRASASVRQIVEAPIGRHSEKPPIVRESILELMGGGAAIELFARQSAPGWDRWGEEAPDE